MRSRVPRPTSRPRPWSRARGLSRRWDAEATCLAAKRPGPLSGSKRIDLSKLCDESCQPKTDDLCALSRNIRPAAGMLLAGRGGDRALRLSLRVSLMRPDEFLDADAQPQTRSELQ